MSMLSMLTCKFFRTCMFGKKSHVDMKLLHVNMQKLKVHVNMQFLRSTCDVFRHACSKQNRMFGTNSHVDMKFWHSHVNMRNPHVNMRFFPKIHVRKKSHVDMRFPHVNMRLSFVPVVLYLKPFRRIGCTDRD
jgi:hypothetical protein